MKVPSVVLPVLLILIFSMPSLFGTPRIVDPGIPNQEYTRYKVTNGDDISIMDVTVNRFQKEGGLDVYGVSVRSKDEITDSVLLRDSLLPINSRSVNTRGDISLTTTQAIDIPEKEDPGVIRMFSFTDLLHILRGYPFDKPEEFQIKMFSSNRSDDDSFAMSIAFVERETITLNGKEYPCHVLELNTKISGAMRMFSFMIPDTQFWFSVDPPHRLVRYTGMGGSGGPGSDPLVIEISE